MGYGKRQLEVRGYRGQIPSPGRPTVAWRQDRVQFWAAIAQGARSEDAALEIGVSPAVGTRWFRDAVKDPYLADQTERIEQRSTWGR